MRRPKLVRSPSVIFITAFFSHPKKSIRFSSPHTSTRVADMSRPDRDVAPSADDADKVFVAVRVRPLSERERALGDGAWDVSSDGITARVRRDERSLAGFARARSSSRARTVDGIVWCR